MEHKDTMGTSDDILTRLTAVIRARRDAPADASYTRRLLDDAPKRPAKKLGEEAVETVIAALVEDDDALRAEAADLLYHLLVLLESRRIDIAEVLMVLESRIGVSGLTDKANRKAI